MQKRSLSPKNHRVFDPWNSASSGHQRADSGYLGTTRWRDTRIAKLKQQFGGEECTHEKLGVLGDADFAQDGCDGGGDWRVGGNDETMSMVVDAAGKEGRGKWEWISDEEAKRLELGVRDIRCFMGVGKRKSGEQLGEKKRKKPRMFDDVESVVIDRPAEISVSTTTASPALPPPPPDHESKSHIKPQNLLTNLSNPLFSTSIPSSIRANDKTHPPSSKIFHGTTIYINGSTLPQISDHKLKSLLAENGATVAIAMARRSVSHIIIGQPGVAGQGCGGGLAARKLQGEIERGGWKGVRIVGVDWVLESLKAGKRLAESKFAVMSIAPKGQRSVSVMLGKG
ncbi:hypothetical protein PDE_04094 [Penicillium oxalicum 114-2]|uniref:BRCT domain-containing protein n=1 Tax=Penicillium oxalicum (strain 114-2 / CGMCC 5302) TaxID=933388 RepID=S7ZEP9_PENO1|nr:hypothetical protein PDE_04094 [Penicillium oxalicum 114-2]